MTKDDDPSSRLDPKVGSVGWPVVSPDDIGVPDFEADLAYMGFNLRLKIRNSSSYLVREAALRIDGKGPGIPGQATRGGVVTSREVKVGPLLPGVYVCEEVGIGAQGGINGLGFVTLSAQAVRLTPPDLMRPAADYPALTADIIDVGADDDAPDLRRREGDWLGEPRTAPALFLRIRVRNSGPAIVDRVRLKLTYFDDGGAGSGRTWDPAEVADWILDMPSRDWNPYQLPDSPDASIEPAEPLPPGESYEFTLAHYDGGPNEWAGRLDATKVEVVEVRLASVPRSPQAQAT